MTLLKNIKCLLADSSRMLVQMCTIFKGIEYLVHSCSKKES